MMFKQLKLADVFSIFNAAFGFTGIVYLHIHGLNPYTFYFLYLSSYMDGADGVIANRFGKSPFGKDLDSLADSISFGVFPGLIVAFYNSTLFFPALIFTLASILRLARFNVINSQNFIGCPTVAAALLVTSLTRLNFSFKTIFIVVLVAALLMVSDIEYPKIRNRALLLFVGIVLLLCFAADEFVYILLILIVIYLISPIFKEVIGWKNL